MTLTSADPDDGVGVAVHLDVHPRHDGRHGAVQPGLDAQVVEHVQTREVLLKHYVVPCLREVHVDRSVQNAP